MPSVETRGRFSGHSIYILPPDQAQEESIDEISFGAQLDVTNEEERLAVVERTVEAPGGLDFLFNNAGGGGPKPFDMPLGNFEWSFQLNVYRGGRPLSGVARFPLGQWPSPDGQRRRCSGTRLIFRCS